MNALVLAAGKGSRLGGAAGGVPKPLVPIAGTTPLEQALRQVARLRPRRIWVNVHARAEMIRRHVGAAVDGVPIHFVYEPELLGTAGAWKHLEPEWRGPSLVVYGDNYAGFDLRRLVQAHIRRGRIATIAVFDPARHGHTGGAGGRVRLRDGLVVRFTEGGSTGLVNAGVYCLEGELAAQLPAGFLDFGHDVLPRLAAAGALAGCMIEDGGFCLGVDTPERLRLARRQLGRGTLTWSQMTRSDRAGGIPA